MEFSKAAFNEKQNFVSMKLISPATAFTLILYIKKSLEQNSFFAKHLV